MSQKLCAALLLLFTVASVSADDRVEITGGADETGQNYTWKIKNKGSAAITRIIIPHYRCDTFNIPTGWERGECTNLARVSQKDAPGICEAIAKNGGIGQGGSAEFGMRLSRVGADERVGSVTVFFADGSQTQVSGVKLPTQKGFLERNITPIALVVIFAIFVVIQHRRRGAQAGATGSVSVPATKPD